MASSVDIKKSTQPLKSSRFCEDYGSEDHLDVLKGSEYHLSLLKGSEDAKMVCADGLSVGFHTILLAVSSPVFARMCFDNKSAEEPEEDGGMTSTDESKDATTTAEEAKDATTTAEEAKDATTTAEEGKDATTTAEEVEDAATTAEEEGKDATNTAEEAKDATTTAEEEGKDATNTAEEAKDATTTAEEGKDATNTAEETKDATTTAEEEGKDAAARKSGDDRSASLSCQDTPYHMERDADGILCVKADVTTESFKLFKEYLYKGKTAIPSPGPDLRGLMDLAHTFCVKPLEHMIMWEIQNCMFSTSKVCDVCGDAPEGSCFERLCLSYIEDNFNAIASQTSLGSQEMSLFRLRREQLSELVECGFLSGCGEFDLFLACQAWGIHHQMHMGVPTVKEALGDVLQNIRFPLMSPQALRLVGESGLIDSEHLLSAFMGKDTFFSDKKRQPRTNLFSVDRMTPWRLTIYESYVNNLKEFDCDEDTFLGMSIAGALSSALSKGSPDLATLKLRSLRITSIPISIMALKNLATLNLAGNRIANLTSVSHLVGMKGLTSLDLSDNRIDNLAGASALARLKGLKILNLSSNRVKDIAPLSALKDLEEFEKLYLSHNPFEDSSAVTLLLTLKNLKLVQIPFKTQQDIGNLTRQHTPFSEYTEYRAVSPQP